MSEGTSRFACAVCGTPADPEDRHCRKCGATLVPPARESEDPLIGKVVAGRFLILKRIGAGGMGTVYRAEQLSVHRQVALKLLYLRGYIEDRTLASRFRVEAEAAGRLTSPHTVITYDFGEAEEGSLFIAMELLEGRTLADEVKTSGPLSVARAFMVADRIAASIGEAHGLGIIHRDLKPENVMLVRRGEDPDFVKVLDFGIAKVVAEDGTDQRTALTKTGMVFGTPQYMAPEQIRGETLGPQADIYALGVMLYEMLSGRLPFIASSPMGVLTMHLTEPPPPLASLAPDLPAEAVAVVEKAMARQASDRFHSMDELAHAMRRAREGSASTLPSRQAAPAQAPQAVIRPQPAPRASKAPKALIALVAALVLVSVAAVALLITRPWQQAEQVVAVPVPPLEQAAPLPKVAQAEPQAPEPKLPPLATEDAGQGRTVDAGKKEPVPVKTTKPPEKPAAKPAEKKTEVICRVTSSGVEVDAKMIANLLRANQPAIETCLAKDGKTPLKAGFQVAFAYGGGAPIGQFDITGDTDHRAICLTRYLRQVSAVTGQMKQKRASTVVTAIDAKGACTIQVSSKGLTKPPAGTTKPPADTTKPPAGTTKPPAGTTDKTKSKKYKVGE